MSGSKSCLVAPGVVVPPWATEIVLSHSIYNLPQGFIYFYTFYTFIDNLNLFPKN